MKKIINNEIFFFHRLCPLQTVKNRRKPWKNRHPKSTIFSPLVFHRLRLLDERLKPPLLSASFVVSLNRSGTAKGGRPWRGSVKIEPGFFSRFFKNPEKNREKARLKPGKNLLENVESTQKVGDLVMS